jgi:hypothetical protein
MYILNDVCVDAHKLRKFIGDCVSECSHHGSGKYVANYLVSLLTPNTDEFYQPQICISNDNLTNLYNLYRHTIWHNTEMFKCIFNPQSISP